MGKRIVIALGGNALGKNLHEQMDAVHVTAKAIADLIQDGHEAVIAHGNGNSTLYAHMSSRAVSEGQMVSQGQTIGYVGTTGSSTGNHLHLEVRDNYTRVDPESKFPSLSLTHPW